MKILLDTNVLIRSLEPLAPQHQVAHVAVAALLARGHELRLVPQNLYEFWVASTRPLAQNGRGRTPKDAASELVAFKSQFTLLPDTAAIFDEWERLVSTYNVAGKPPHDARLVAAMRAHGVTHLLTFNDGDFKRYPAVTAITPAVTTVTPP